jgi:hypothetical protein
MDSTGGRKRRKLYKQKGDKPVAIPELDQTIRSIFISITVFGLVFLETPPEIGKNQRQKIFTV